MADQSTNPPLKAAELGNLVNLGIDNKYIKFKNVTMESDKYIVVGEENEGKVAIIETTSMNCFRIPVKTSSAIMNPVSKVIGLRAGNQLQIYNLEMRTKMKETKMRETENVVFWKWLDAKTIAIVTDKSAFHWSMEGTAEPRKIFDRTPYKGRVQITNYSSTPDGKWIYVCGIAQAEGGGGIQGVLQLYSVERRASQPTLNAPAACFARAVMEGRSTPSNLFCFVHSTPAGPKMSIVEVGQAKEQTIKKIGDLKFMTPDDFAVHLIPDPKHGLLYLLSKTGCLFAYDITSAKCLWARQVNKSTLFQAVSHTETGGIIAIDLTGRILLFSIDETNLVPFICNVMSDYDMGARLARNYNLPGADNVFKQQFEQMMATGRIDAACKLAAEAPQDVLRTPETIARLQSAQPIMGKPAVLQYFKLLLSKGKLNHFESIELTRPLITTPAGKKHIEEWIKQDKLFYSEELGDLLKTQDIKLALAVYLRANCPTKSIGCFLQLGQFDKIVAYSESVNFTPDFALLLKQLHAFDKESAKKFATMLVNSPKGLIQVQNVVDIFMFANDVPNTTSFLLDYLKKRGNRPEDADFQTRVLEINLLSAPQVADAIMESDEYKFTHYNKPKIAQLCERAQLFQRALENYTDLEDIKRIMMNTHLIDPKFLLNFLGTLTPDDALASLRALIKFNLQQNIMLCIEAAKRYSSVIGPDKLIRLFEEFKSHNGLYYYLGSFVNQCQDSKVIFKYIEAAVKLNQFPEVERICRENEHYDSKQIKDFLIKMNLKDPRPLIHVCDRHDYIPELTRHLFGNQQLPFLTVYIQKMNPSGAPNVIGTLIDLNAPEDKLIEIIASVPAPQKGMPGVPHCPIKDLVEQVEKRQRLILLRPWLESRLQEGLEDPDLHNSLAKIYVDTHNNAQQFLTNNKFYDSLVVGKFCESRDPQLSIIAYKRANGSCDTELLQLCNTNGFFKDEARYLVSRTSIDLWGQVLTPNNEFRRQIIDQVVSTALPESKVPEEISTCVQAFMNADMPFELIELLEKIVLHAPKDSAFRNHPNLQNLLIFTAIRSDKKRVMDYINRLDKYDAAEIARLAVSDEYQLYEEALILYKKCNMISQAMNVLLLNIKDMKRAVDYAEQLNTPEVWTILAKAQLNSNEVTKGIKSYLKAQDPDNYDQVIQAAKNENLFKDLIEYLMMAREKIREPVIDNSIIISYAKLNKLAELDQFISSPNTAQLEEVGDQCCESDMYEAAKILYLNAQNQAKYSLCLIKLGKYLEAVEAARKANSITTWKAVCYACIDAKEFRLAAVCGMNIIIYMDHLNELIKYYESNGYTNEIMTLLEQGLNTDRAHNGIFTQLGVLYARHKPDSLIDHIKYYWQKINIPTLLKVCKDNLRWKEAVLLHSHYDQHDAAIDLMIEHSSECWEHERFKEIITKVSNTEVFYKGLSFYLKAHEDLLNDLLIELSNKVDHPRVVLMFREDNKLSLIQKYLIHVQRNNIPAVNDAVNELYITAGDFKSLRESIDAYDKFNQLKLAKTIEIHESPEFRRISAYLYKRIEKYDESIELSKKDEFYNDAIQTALESKKIELNESLLRYFVDTKKNDMYSQMLGTCYNLIRPDTVTELSWKYNLRDESMPYQIKYMRDLQTKNEELHQRLKNLEEKDKKPETGPQDPLAFMQGAPLALPAPGQVGQYNQPPLGQVPLGQQFGQPQMGLPQMGQPQMGQPQMGQPQMGQPQMMGQQYYNPNANMMGMPGQQYFPPGQPPM